MKIPVTLRRVVAPAVASALAASALLATTSATATADVPPATHGVDVDYFDDVYTALGPDSVFENVTVERFEYLLKSKPGSFAFLIGDPGNASTQATIGHVDAVAKDLGVEKVYVFTPKLDGKTLDLWNIAASGLRTGTSPDPAGGNRAGQGAAQFEAVGNRLLNDYLNKDQQTQFAKNPATDPYLFVYDKDRKVGDADDRIVAALSGAKTAADLDTPAEVTAYRAEVRTVLDSVPELATNSQFEFNRDEHNRKHFERYVRDADPAAQADKLARFGGDIFDASDAADGFRIETITYPELVHLLQQPGDIPILFGGTWCHNTAAIIKDVNRLAQEKGIKKVYNVDFALDGITNSGGSAFHIRDNALTATVDGTAKALRPSHLYGDLVNTYLTNAITQYRKPGDPGASGENFVQYHPGGDTSKPLEAARKIQVGHLLTYNKDRVDADGNRAPVVDQAIRQNDDGGNTEHMTEWWFVKGRDLAAGDATLRGSNNPASEAGSNGLQSQRAFAKEAIAEIDTILGGLVAPSGLPSTTSATGVGGAGDPEVKLGDTPTISVSVAANRYAPFISLNSAGAQTVPNNAVGKPRGVVTVLDGQQKVAEARLKRDGTAQLTLSGLTAGPQELVVRYGGRGDAIAPSQQVLDFDVVGDPSTTTLAGAETAVFGAGATLTATVTDGATGSVTLSGLPGAPLQATIVDDVATFQVPAGTPAGAYSLTAQYAGDDTFGSSQSEARSFTVTKATSATRASAPASRYGAAPKVTVAVTGQNGRVPTGQVRLSGVGAVKVATLSSTGRATFTLPKTLTPKTYALTATYVGDANVTTSSTKVSLKIAKGVSKLPTFKPTAPAKASKQTKATVTVPTTAGLAKATGKVTLVITKGGSTKYASVTLKAGTGTVTLPKLAAGTWKVKLTYKGDARYAPSGSFTRNLVVAR